ncbi:MAG: isoprenyl transferase [Desulfocapsaceae bacterium]|nr:isoprenyl transferase [Desulfocapsaceae bacterium]
MSIPFSLDLHRLPEHVAIVMDGNGRWAERRHKPRLYGHRAGADSVRDIVEISREIGIKVLTLYAFSSENWNRPATEVSGLMTILSSYLTSELSRMLKNDIRLISIGDMMKLPEQVRSVLQESIEKTSGNSSLILNLALSYGSRNEMVRAVQILSEKCVRGQLTPGEISSQTISDHLYTAGISDPDLLIRTGGEARLSNFLLWQASYSEIYFTDVMWPDFKRQQFLEAIADFQNRERRFGKTGAQLHKK